MNAVAAAAAVDNSDKLQALHEADHENGGCHLNIYHEHAR